MTEEYKQIDIDGNSKLSKWFLGFEIFFIASCIACKYFVHLDAMIENVFMGVLAAISAVFITFVVAKRVKSRQYKYITNLVLLILFTILVIVWCVNKAF